MRTITTCLIAVGALTLLAGCRSPSAMAVYAEGNSRGVCPVHHQPMKLTNVPLGYGYVVRPSDGPGAKAVQFPFAHWFLMDGGPIMLDEPPKDTTPSYLCPQCEKMKLAWIEQHPDREWSKEKLADYRRLQEFKHRPSP